MTPPEEHQIDLNALVSPNIGVVVGGLAIVLLVALLVLAVQARRIANLRSRLEGLTRDTEGRSLEAILDAHLDRVFAVSRDLDELAARAAVLEAAGRKAFQRAGLVRYNPFEDTGGNQSFALALLDANGDGVLLNSLHTRNGTRVYARALSAGRAEGALSDEEAEALRRALGGSIEAGRAPS